MAINLRSSHQNTPYWISMLEYRVKNNVITDVVGSVAAHATDFTHVGHIYKNLIEAHMGFCRDKVSFAAKNANFDDIWTWQPETESVQCGWSIRHSGNTRQIDVHVYRSDPKNTAFFVELAISAIYECSLPLNPKQLIDMIVTSPNNKITKYDIMEYMGDTYGWNDSFYIEPMYSHATSL